MNNKTLPYRPEIDGLRAIAVTLVILYHTDFGIINGGFIGVDVFFVISGFLITSLLMGDLERGEFSFKKFYERRCRRILPPLVVMGLVVTVASWFYLLPVDFRTYGSSLVAMATFWANQFFFQKSGYFDTESFTKPILHTWSLSVEEQFYIILPIMLYLVYRKWRTKLPAVMIGLVVASLACSQILAIYEADAAFYLLPSRFWELLVGSLLAILPLSWVPQGKKAVLMAWGGLAAIIGSALLFSSQTVFPGLSATLPCFGAAMFILATSDASQGKSHLLAHSCFVGIGKISYSLYLWHWPLLVVPRYFNDDPLTVQTTFAILVSTVILSYLSWRFVESPIRFRKVLKSRRAVFIASLVSILTLVGMGLAIRHSDGFPSRLPESAQPFAKSVSDRYNSPPWQKYKYTAKLNGVTYRFTAWDVNPDKAPPSFLLLGNSHARMWLAAVDALAMEHGVSGIVVEPSDYRNCSLLSDDEQAETGEWNCNDYITTFMNMAQNRGVKHVVLAIRYSPALGLPIKAENAQESNAVAERYAYGLKKTLKAYQARGIEFWFAENIPEYTHSMPNTLTWNALQGRKPENLGYDVRLYENRNSPLSAWFPVLESEGLHVLRMSRTLCPDGFCVPGDNGGSFYLDDNHLTRYGAHKFKKALAPMFESLACEKP